VPLAYRVAAAGRFLDVSAMRWGRAVPRGTTAVRRTDLSGWGNGKLTRARPSTTVKSGGGDSTFAGRRGGGWRQWSGRRAPGHHCRARGCAGGTGRRPKQAVCVEALGGSCTEGNQRRRWCTMAAGIRGLVEEVTGAHAGLE
jgi:hypothetical protein